MWLVYALLTFLIWGVADIFYKKGNSESDKYSHLKTSITVGFVMGIHALIYAIYNREFVSFLEIVQYLPVSLCYIVSMILGYKGFKYINASVSAPIQNVSWGSILLCIIFGITLNGFEIVGIACMLIGMFLLAVLEVKYDNSSGKEIFRNIRGQAIVFPIMYCILDNLGAVLDSIYLDQFSIISESAALLSYEISFFVYAICAFIFLKVKRNEKLEIFREKNRLCAAIFETLGQFFYVYAIASHSVISIPIISCYSVASVVLARIFLKEKLTKAQYVLISMIFIGILILSIWGEA